MTKGGGLESDTLLTVAEIGATFAGFSALAGLIRRGPRGGAQVEGIVVTSLAAIGFALLPILFSKAGLETAIVLRVSAALVAVIWTALWVRAARGARAILASDPEARPDAVFIALVFINNATGTVLAVVVSCAFFPDLVESLYLAIVLCPLFTAAALLMERRSAGLGGRRRCARTLRHRTRPRATAERVWQEPTTFEDSPRGSGATSGSSSTSPATSKRSRRSSQIRPWGARHPREAPA